MSASSGKHRRCAARRRDGQPCRARARPGRVHCWSHDPELADRRAQARRAGGQHRAAVVRLQQRIPAALQPVIDLALDALRQTHAGRMRPAQGQAIASLCRAVASVYGEAAVELRLDDLERRLAAATGRSPSVVRIPR